MTPAVIIGADVVGLGLARSLGRAGVPVVMAERWRPLALSRHCRRVPLDDMAGPGLVAGLRRIARDLPERPVLFPTRDDTLVTMLEHGEALARLYRFHLPPSVGPLLTKQGIQRFAEDIGVPVPWGAVLHCRAELDALAEIPVPCVIKPGFRDDAYTARFHKVYRIADPAEARAVIAEILEVAPPVVVQEWIEGGDDQLYFCLHYLRPDGGAAASFTGRKARSWPPRTGNTARCLPAPEVAGTLEAASLDFLRRAGIFGWAGVEYKWDGRRFVLMEPTVGRPDAQEEVATVNGINIPLAAYRCLLDEAVPPARPPARPVAWRRDALVDRKAGGDAVTKELPLVDGLWRWSDPLPGLLAYALRPVSAVLHRLPGRRRP